jgi:hypothetical protein
MLTKQEDAEVAFAGLRTGANVLEPASPPSLRQPHLDRLGALAGMLIGLIASLGWAQLSSQRYAQREAAIERRSTRHPKLNLPVLARMTRSCAGDSFAVGHPMRPNTEGPSFAAILELWTRLDALTNRKTNNSLLGITSLVTELNEFGTKEEPSQCRSIKELSKGGCSPTISLVTSTIGALGISHTLARRSVLLVDSNVFGDSLTAHLELVDYLGLAECLTGKEKWQNHVVTIEESKLDVLPLGRDLGQDDELLCHSGFEDLLQNLQRQYDIVLVELPGVNDAPRLPQLTRLLGYVLLVENARLRIDAEECARLLGPPSPI